VTSQHEDWTPHLGPLPGLQFKWGLNGETGEFTIWDVSGPGDGYPSHDTYLATAWGRPPSFDSDLVGMVLVDEETVQVMSLGSAEPPPAPAVEWAKRCYPTRDLQLGPIAPS
jgi:hypothetical protein